MANRDALELDLGRAILTSYDGAYLLAQFDSEGDGQTAAAEVLAPYGQDARPRDPGTDADGNATRGATAMVAMDGRQQHLLVFGDPRCTDLLPTLEKGSSRLYAHVTGDKVTWLRLDGATGSAKLRVPVGSGESTVEIDASTGDITLTHQGGTVLKVKAGSVELSQATGNFPLVKETGALATFYGAIVSAFSGLGVTISPPGAYTCTKVNGT
jgi:hypothetical protein